MVNEKYLSRIVDNQIIERMRVFGIVQVEGARYCGKTWTCRNHSSSSINLADPSNGFQTKNIAKMDPSYVLNGECPRLIDEWQEVPEVRDAAKILVSESGEHGRFLFTGSASPEPGKGPLHGGEGRIAFIRMRPMSLFEQRISNGNVSLRSLFDGGQGSATGTKISIIQLAECIVRGGWPGGFRMDYADAVMIPREYISALERSEIPFGNEMRYDGRKLRSFLRSYARNESSIASLNTIRDLSQDGGYETISADAARGYLSFLSRIFVIEEQPAWRPSLRSATRVQSSPKRHFCDQSLAAAAMNADAEDLIGDLKTFGFLFESMCTRDLRIYAQSLGGTIFHYRDDNGLEVDIIVEIQGGRWAAMEVKLGTDEIDEASKKLLTFGRTVEKKPEFMAVIVGMAEYAYRREDGIFVIPITSLGP